MVHSTSVKLCIRALSPKSYQDMKQAIAEIVGRYESDHKKIRIEMDAESEVLKRQDRNAGIISAMSAIFRKTLPRENRPKDLHEESAVCETMKNIFTEGHFDYELSTYYVNFTAWGWCYDLYIAALKKECGALERAGFGYWLFFSPEERSDRFVGHSKSSGGVSLAKYGEGLRRLERDLALASNEDDDDSEPPPPSDSSSESDDDSSSSESDDDSSSDEDVGESANDYFSGGAESNAAGIAAGAESDGDVSELEDGEKEDDDGEEESREAVVGGDGKSKKRKLEESADSVDLVDSADSNKSIKRRVLDRAKSLRDIIVSDLAAGKEES